MSRIKSTVYVFALVLLAIALYLLPLLTPQAIDKVNLINVPQSVLDKAQGHLSEQGIWYRVDPKTKTGYLFISAGENTNLHIRPIGGGYISTERKMSFSANLSQPGNPSTGPEDYLAVYSFSGFKIKVIEILLYHGHQTAKFTWNP